MQLASVAGKWRSALSELTAALDWLGEHDQVYA
jgi:hypothetical protein